MDLKRFSLQSLLVLGGVGLGGLMLLPIGKSYQVPLIGLLTFAYLVLTIHRNPFKKTVGSWHDSPTLAILSSIVLILVITTGGSESPLFFLLSFVLFSIGFVLYPEVLFVFLGGVLLLFSPQLFSSPSILELVNIGSLLLFSPLSYFFGKIFQKESEEEEGKQERKEIMADATETIQEDIKEIIETTPLPEESRQKLEEISEAAEVVKDATK